MLCITFTYHLPAEIYKQSPKKRSKWCLSRASKVYCGRSTATLGTAGWLQVTAWQHEFHWMLGNIREASIQHYFTNFLVNNVKYLLIHHTLYFIILSKPMKKCKDKSYINQWKNAKTNHIFSKTDQNSNLLIHHISRASTHAMSRSRRPPHAALLGLLQPGRFFKSGRWTPKSWPC